MAQTEYNRNQAKKVKSPATVSDQLAKLKERGCIIEDETEAEKTLGVINYYRLVNYFSVFQDEKKHYREGTSFNKTLRIYDFDRKLRNKLMTMLEDVEIALRATVSNYHALKYGALGYLNPDTFGVNHKHSQFIGKIDRMIETNADEKFVSHHINKYAGAFPLWVIMELFSFGTLVFFYIEMQECDKKELADKSYGLAPRYLENWLLCMSELRNHCAHYNRIYGMEFSRTPKMLPDMTERIPGATLFDYVIAMKYLHRRPSVWNGTFIPELENLIEEYSDVIELGEIGFPAEWKNYLIINTTP